MHGLQFTSENKVEFEKDEKVHVNEKENKFLIFSASGEDLRDINFRYRGNLKITEMIVSDKYGRKMDYNYNEFIKNKEFK